MSSAAEGSGTQQIYKYLKASVDLAIGNGEYHHGQLAELHTNIVSYALKKISGVRAQATKAIVTCTIVQNTGSGFHIGNATRWDESTDSMVTYKFSNKALNIIVTAYLVSS